MQSKSFFRRVSSTVAAAGATVAAVAAPIMAKATTALDTIKDNAHTTAVNSGTVSANAKTLPELVGSFISAALGLLGIVLVVIVIYAGFLWMTAQGNDEKVKQARKMITNAVIGIVLIFAAYAITDFVLKSLATATGA